MSLEAHKNGPINAYKPDGRISSESKLAADVLIERICAIESGDLHHRMPIANRFGQRLISRRETLAMSAPISVKLYHHDLVLIVNLRREKGGSKGGGVERIGRAEIRGILSKNTA